MNVNEFGVRFAFYVAYSIGDFDVLTITFTKPDGSTLVKTSPAVSAPNVDLPTPAGTFPAGEYAQYTFVEGDVDQAGEWSARVTYDTTGSPPVQLISFPGPFLVSP